MILFISSEIAKNSFIVSGYCFEDCSNYEMEVETESYSN